MTGRVQPPTVPAWLPDLAIALAVATLELVNLVAAGRTPHGAVLDAGLLMASAVPLLARRRFPLAVAAIVAVAVVALAALGVPHLGLAMLVALYGIAAFSPVLVRAAFAALTVAATVAVPLLTPDDPADIPRNLALFGAAWLLGALHRQRTAYTGELERRAEQLLAQQQENARLAADVERGRIARELHDVIAHALSVMIVQTGAARTISTSDPEHADRLLARVEAVGQDSLSELRDVLGRLRTGGDAAPLEPRPGLAHLDELVHRFQATGLPVELAITGKRRHVSASVDLAAYRIVQEGLTNALKHAQRPTRVEVKLAFTPTDIALEVRDDAPQRSKAVANGGHGLSGIRERAALLGGSAAAGPIAGGGFRVSAVLPADQRR